MKAYHYTTGERWAWIRLSGELLPAAAGIHPIERPIIWFSLHPHFEPTARKALARDVAGVERIVSLMEPREMRERAGGLYRLGTDPATLLKGEALRRAARMPPKVWRSLHDDGRARGANPAQWLGAVAEALPIAGLDVECMDDGGRWVPAP